MKAAQLRMTASSMWCGHIHADGSTSYQQVLTITLGSGALVVSSSRHRPTPLSATACMLTPRRPWSARCLLVAYNTWR
eukprot:COSAG01_NODE_646_length_14556_cov_9.736806_14_plen_78_part_00